MCVTVMCVCISDGMCLYCYRVECVLCGSDCSGKFSCALPDLAHPLLLHEEVSVHTQN